MSFINQDLKTYLDNLYDFLDGDLGNLQTNSYAQNLPIIPKDVVNFLQLLFSIRPPKNVLEIGCAVGFSSSFISTLLQQGGHITTIERYPLMIEKATENIKNLGFEDKITILQGDANDILKNLEGSFDLIFMDAGKGQYINILPDVYRLLSVDGILIADDVLQKGTVALDKSFIQKRQRTIHYRLNDFLFEITHNKSLKTSILPIGDGLAICHKINNIKGLVKNYE